MWERWQLLRTTTEGPLFKGEEGDWRGETEAHRTGPTWSTCSSSRRLVTVEPKAQEGPDGPREGQLPDRRAVEPKARLGQLPERRTVEPKARFGQLTKRLSIITREPRAPRAKGGKN